MSGVSFMRQDSPSGGNVPEGSLMRDGHYQPSSRVTAPRTGALPRDPHQAILSRGRDRACGHRHKRLDMARSLVRVSVPRGHGQRRRPSPHCPPLDTWLLWTPVAPSSCLSLPGALAERPSLQEGGGRGHLLGPEGGVLTTRPRVGACEALWLSEHLPLRWGSLWPEGTEAHRTLWDQLQEN